MAVSSWKEQNAKPNTPWLLKISEASGALKSVADSAYGEAASWDGEWSEPAQSYTGTSQGDSRYFMPYLYTGQRLDRESGLYYYKNRYYDPAMGRFLRRDPLGYADGPNPYQYASSHPARNRDPLGLRSDPVTYGAYNMAMNARARIDAMASRGKELTDLTNEGVYIDWDSREEKVGETADGDAATEYTEAKLAQQGRTAISTEVEPSDQDGATTQVTTETASGETIVEHQDADGNTVTEETDGGAMAGLEQIVERGLEMWKETAEKREDAAQVVEQATEVISLAETIGFVLPLADPEPNTKVALGAASGVLATGSQTGDATAFLLSPTPERFVNAAISIASQGVGRAFGRGCRELGLIDASLGEELIDLIERLSASVAPTVGDD